MTAKANLIRTIEDAYADSLLRTTEALERFSLAFKQADRRNRFERRRARRNRGV